jgi:cytochrome P450 family 142 subfamily A polypeptide 1
MTADVPSPPTPLDSDLERRASAYRSLRAEGGVVPFPGVDGVLAAVSYEAVDVGLRSVEHFGGSAGQDDIPDVDKNIAGMVEPRHGKVRRIMNSVVAFHKSQQIEPYLQDLVARLVDGLLEEARVNGERGVDVVPHLAVPIPPAAMARLFGFPEEDAKEYYRWVAEGGRRFQEAAATGASIAAADANPEQAEYIDQKIEERLVRPRDEWPEDALTRFLVTEVEGERLEPRNIRAQIMFMIGAGSDTTKNLIGSLLFRLGRDPRAYAALRADPELIDVAIEEALRMDAPAQFMVRTCREPLDLAGTPLDEGQRVFMCIGSGNHDETKFDDPDTFRLDRPTREHLSFGSGPHICPGAALARLEVRTLMHEFTKRIVAFHLVDPDHYDALPTYMLQGQRSLRIVVDAEAPDSSK